MNDREIHWLVIAVPTALILGWIAWFTRETMRDYLELRRLSDEAPAIRVRASADLRTFLLDVPGSEITVSIDHLRDSQCACEAETIP